MCGLPVRSRHAFKMASVVTVVSRFCYRSPTRPLFVAGLIFLILITWKFLVAQPDANALMMHSKAEKTWSQRNRVIYPKQPVAIQSASNTEKTLKRLVNKLPEIEVVGGADKQDKRDDSSNSNESIEGETQNGDRTEKPAVKSKQNGESNVPGKNTRNKDLIIKKGVSIEETRLKINQNQDENKKQIGEINSNLGKNTHLGDKTSSFNRESQPNGFQKERLKESNDKNKGHSNNEKQSIAVNQPDSQTTLDSSKSKESPSNRGRNAILTNTTPLDFPVGEYNILLTLVKMTPQSPLAMSMKKFLKSLCRRTSVKLTLHAVVDDIGKMVVQDFFKTATGLCKETQVVIHKVKNIVNQLKPWTKLLQDYFSREKSYYSDPIFFMSTAIHKVFTEKLKQVIMMDVDLRFVSDIKKLFDMFNNFNNSNILGLAREQSPVYRHILYQYRGNHKGTLVGDPPPKGVPGFNSGVVLFNLENMRKSSLYNNILQGQEVKRLSDKFFFKGHLGDQDFFTLLSFEYPELFYTLPCSWNRQLCTYWRDNGYAEVFNQYANCSEPIHVYHGNCRTPIPVDNES